MLLGEPPTNKNYEKNLVPFTFPVNSSGYKNNTKKIIKFQEIK